MKQFFTMLMVCFFSMTIFAGVGAYNGSTNLGFYGYVKCGDNITCSKQSNGKFLQLDVGDSSGNILVDKKLSYTPSTFVSGDTSPSVLGGALFKTFVNNTVTIASLDNSTAGQQVIILAQGPVTLDVTGTMLKCGTTDLVLASGDVTTFVCDGTDCYCSARSDASDNQN